MLASPKVCQCMDISLKYDFSVVVRKGGERPVIPRNKSTSHVVESGEIVG